MQTRWNDRVYSLENIVVLHWNYFFQLQLAANHINFQLPTKH